MKTTKDYVDLKSIGGASIKIDSLGRRTHPNYKVFAFSNYKYEDRSRYYFSMRLKSIDTHINLKHCSRKLRNIKCNSYFARRLGETMSPLLDAFYQLYSHSSKNTYTK